MEWARRGEAAHAAAFPSPFTLAAAAGTGGVTVGGVSAGISMAAGLRAPAGKVGAPKSRSTSDDPRVHTYGGGTARKATKDFVDFSSDYVHRKSRGFQEIGMEPPRGECRVDASSRGLVVIYTWWPAFKRTGNAVCMQGERWGGTRGRGYWSGGACSQYRR